MKVILLKQVPKVGKKDDIVEVAQGYAQNALFPRKLAIPATATAIDALKRSQQNKIAEKAIRHQLLDTAIKSINDQEVVMTVKASKEGSLFSKLHQTDIATFLEKEHRIVIDPSCIILADGPIKKTGVYDVTITDDDYTGQIKLIIK